MNVLKKLSTILFPNTEEPYQISDPTAVKVDAQELTEAQQMQARENLGLYATSYEEWFSWDGAIEGKETVTEILFGGIESKFVRVSENPVDFETLVGAVVTVSGAQQIRLEEEFVVTAESIISSGDVLQVELVSGVPVLKVIKSDTSDLKKGVYVLNAEASVIAQIIGAQVENNIFASSMLVKHNVTIPAEFLDFTKTVVSINSDDTCDLSFGTVNKLVKEGKALFSLTRYGGMIPAQAATLLDMNINGTIQSAINIDCFQTNVTDGVLKLTAVNVVWGETSGIATTSKEFE